MGKLETDVRATQAQFSSENIARNAQQTVEERQLQIEAENELKIGELSLHLQEALKFYAPEQIRLKDAEVANQKITILQTDLTSKIGELQTQLATQKELNSERNIEKIVRRKAKQIVLENNLEWSKTTNQLQTDLQT
jgi:hypothetical protein